MSCCSSGSCHCGDPMMKAACLLVLVGAINWGLVGLGGFLGMNLNVVNLLLGTWPQVEWIVYILVGLAGAFKVLKCCKSCGSDMPK
ncbi:MAG: hypothetical protein G01um101425_614 [Candidatus Peregrinibacteria bacterium Gr01-1014_25]|nr:MAG: hypothetical protein G01um101425_614 [Candidatus Peregrinibacteria bacterium Gr01-1014_25]